MSKNGFNDMAKQLQKIANNAEKLSKKKSIPLVELLSPTFMQKHSKSESLESFLSDLGVTDDASFKALPQEELEAKVKQDTDFDSWHDMQDTAVHDYMTKHLGF